MNPGCDDLEQPAGPGAGPRRDRELAGLSRLWGAWYLVRLGPGAGAQTSCSAPRSLVLGVFQPQTTPGPAIATALPVSQAPACQHFCPLGGDEPASCLSSVTRRVRCSRSSSLAAAMGEFCCPLALGARWSKDPLPGLPSPLRGRWGHDCASNPQHLHHGGYRARQPGTAPASCQALPGRRLPGRDPSPASPGYG